MSLPLYAGKFEAIDLLEKTGLEYTRFSNGMFMDYWFDPYIPSAFSSNIPSWVDLANNFAAIPGDGNQPLVLTHSCDVGKFVAAALELDKWETRLCLVGDRITINEFLRIAEDVKGVQFEKHCDTMEMLEAGKCTLAPALLATLPPGFDAGMITPLIAGAGKRVTLGEMDIPTEGSLNQRFPELETFKVKEAVKFWFERQAKSAG